MALSKVTYLGELRTSATHLQSGSEIISDAPLDNEGKGQAFSPTDQLATSLATCMLTIMGIRARDLKVDMSGATAEVTKIMSSNPRRVAEIKVAIHMPSNPFSDREKKVLEQSARTCPVMYSLHPDIRKDIIFIWK
nr:OsmC family protein [Saprospiraceae bacterium]